MGEVWLAFDLCLEPDGPLSLRCGPGSGRGRSLPKPVGDRPHPARPLVAHHDLRLIGAGPELEPALDRQPGAEQGLFRHKVFAFLLR